MKKQKIWVVVDKKGIIFHEAKQFYRYEAFSKKKNAKLFCFNNEGETVRQIDWKFVPLKKKKN